MRLTEKNVSNSIHDEMEKIRERIAFAPDSMNPYIEEMAYIETYEMDKLRYEKLGQLEDIEEELGIDLITLFKALKNGLYTTYCGEIDFMFSSQLSYEPTVKCIIVHLNHYTITLELADYGKTWALTKEELN